MNRILLIDDDKELCRLLVDYLEGEDLQVEAVHEGRAALELTREDSFDLIVLDIMLPGLSGIDVLRKIRERSNVPVLMLSARGDDVDRIVGLELGADDYIPKPCNPRELLARIRAVLRRTVSADDQPGGELHINDLVLNPLDRTVRADGGLIELTSTEFTMLEILMREAGSIVSKETLSERGLGRPLGRYDRSVDMHMSNLRRKLGPGRDGEHRMETVRGVGYQLRILT